MLEAMGDEVRLTTLSHGAGCACKLGPRDLAEVLSRLEPAALPPEVLVSAETMDDAAVYRLPDGSALVQSVDFFTPIVDDPFDWGRIAATNALSDLYAMGARPLLALNLVAWPVQDLPLDLLARVLEGGAKVAAEAGVAVVGGHSIHDPEPKYGMAVTGLSEPNRVLRNSTARAGARIVLTKPIGTGIISTAVKKERAEPREVQAAIDLMTTLNRAASEAVLEVGADAVTDVTGFGLLGHLHELAAASGVAAEVDAGAVPLLSGVAELARAGVVPGGTRSNRDYLDPWVEWGDLPDEERLILADAQTSGGLLVAVPEERLERLRRALEARDVHAAVIGRIGDGEPGRIAVGGRLPGA
jgi:selenide, water dikinase